MKKILNKETCEILLLTSVVFGFIGLVIYNSLVYGTWSAPW